MRGCLDTLTRVRRESYAGYPIKVLFFTSKQLEEHGSELVRQLSVPQLLQSVGC